MKMYSVKLSIGMFLFTITSKTKRLSFHKNHIILKSEKYEGAYVKDPQVGMHKWVMSFDLNSLYPHLIMQYNLSPETLVSGDFIKDDLVEIPF